MLFQLCDLVAEFGNFFLFDGFRVFCWLDWLGCCWGFGGFFGDECRRNGEAQSQREGDPKGCCAFDAFPIGPDGCDGAVGSQDAGCSEGKAAAGRKQGGVEEKLGCHFAQSGGFKCCKDCRGVAAPFSEKCCDFILRSRRKVCCVWVEKPRENGVLQELGAENEVEKGVRGRQVW